MTTTLTRRWPARHPAGHRGLGRNLVGGLFLVMGGVHLGLVAADPQVYGPFADSGLFPFVRTGWHDVVMANPALYGLLLIAGEVTSAPCCWSGAAPPGSGGRCDRLPRPADALRLLDLGLVRARPRPADLARPPRLRPAEDPAVTARRVPRGPLRRIVELACRAPSVHNTQPWPWRGGPDRSTCTPTGPAAARHRPGGPQPGDQLRRRAAPRAGGRGRSAGRHGDPAPRPRPARPAGPSRTGPRHSVPPRGRSALEAIESGAPTGGGSPRGRSPTSGSPTSPPGVDPRCPRAPAHRRGRPVPRRAAGQPRLDVQHDDEQVRPSSRRGSTTEPPTACRPRCSRSPATSGPRDHRRFATGLVDDRPAARSRARTG